MSKPLGCCSLSSKSERVPGKVEHDKRVGLVGKLIKVLVRKDLTRKVLMRKVLMRKVLSRKVLH